MPEKLPGASKAPPRPALDLTGEDDQPTLTGALNIGTLAQAAALLKKISKRGRPSRTLDIAGLDSLDTPGALLLCGLRDQGITLVGVRDEHRALLDLVYGLD